jgi:hypothetical protein
MTTGIKRANRRPPPCDCSMNSPSITLQSGRRPGRIRATHTCCMYTQVLHVCRAAYMLRMGRAAHMLQVQGHCRASANLLEDLGVDVVQLHVAPAPDPDAHHARTSHTHTTHTQATHTQATHTQATHSASPPPAATTIHTRPSAAHSMRQGDAAPAALRIQPH